jgi:predicted RNA-binding Zn-ribbon protein involved in translation (DUF1610 family)
MAQRSTVVLWMVIGLGAALMILVMAVTTSGKSPPCPRCGAAHAIARVSAEKLTLYSCSKCGFQFPGPGRQDFSWVGALQEYLSDPPIGSTGRKGRDEAAGPGVTAGATGTP